MKKRLWKTIAVVLTVAILITSLPLAIIAAALQPEEESLSVETAASSIVEIVELRTVDTKTFRLENGNYYLVQYDTAVHTLDENGQWQDIDNTLSESGDEIVTGDAKIKFSKKTTGSEKLFTIYEGNRKLTLSLNGTKKKVKAQIANADSEFSENTTALEKMTSLSKISASVTYEEILEDTDLRYVIEGENIKEYIIVKDRAEAYSYSFTLSLEGLMAVMNGDGGVSVQDILTDEIVYTIPAPVMWDAAGEISDRASMTLLSLKEGAYTLTVSADSEWMNAENRAFPITIDPPICTEGMQGSVDLTLSVGNSTYNDSTSDTMTVDANKRVYWKQSNLPSLPRLAYVTAATFYLQCVTPEGPMQADVAVYDVESNWDSTLTYAKVTNSTNSQGDPADYYTDTTSISFVSESNNFISGTERPSWVITPLVKKWYAGQNYGLMLAPTPGGNFTSSLQFYSGDYPVSNVAIKKPYLDIEYVDMKGLEEYWSYTSQSAGFAGSGAINNATGSLSFAIPTLTTTDSLMPYTPTLTYHSSMAGLSYQYDNAQIAFGDNSPNYTPNGFKWSMQETLIKKDIGGQPWYILSDSDGTEHYFAWDTTINASCDKYRDVDGLQLSLYEYSEYCVIEDNDFNERTYEQIDAPDGTSVAYVLTSIQDKNSNESIFIYDETDRLTDIVLTPKNSSQIQQLKIEYDDEDMPYLIWNPTTREAVILRYSATATGMVTPHSGMYLRQVIRAHGALSSAEWKEFYSSNGTTSLFFVEVDGIAEYTYDSSGHLKRIHNLLSDYMVEYSITNNKVTLLTEYFTATDENTMGQQMVFTYLSSSTEVQTSGSDDILHTDDDLLTIYGFDADGRTVSRYTTDLTRTVLHGASSGEYVGVRDNDNFNAKNSIKSSVQTAAHSSNFLLNGSFETVDGTSSTAYWSTVNAVARSNTHEGIGGGNRRSYGVALSPGYNAQRASLSQDVYLDAGEYTLSFYAKGTIHYHSATVQAISAQNTDHDVVAEIPAERLREEGDYVYCSISFRADPATPGGKEQFTILFALEGRYSEVIIDEVMLSKTLGESGYDALQMGHFEQSNGTTLSPTSKWNVRTGNDYGGTCGIEDSGISAFGDIMKMETQGKVLALEQTVFEGSASNPISVAVSGFGKCEAQSAGTGYFRLEISVQYANDPLPSITEIPFNPSIREWQFTSGSVKTSPEKGAVTSIKVAILCYNNASACYVDNISCELNGNSASYYDYSDSGKLLSVYAEQKQAWNYYDSNYDQLVKSISSDGEIVEYTYDALLRVISMKTFRYQGTVDVEDGTVNGSQSRVSATSYQYNNYGQIVYERQMGISDTSSISYVTEFSYYTNARYFGALAIETDELDQDTHHFYDDKAHLKATRYPNGNGLYYTYDGMGNLIGVEEGQFTASGSTYVPSAKSDGTEVNYIYDSETKRLSTIVTESTTYSFTYDIFGNAADVGVGDRTLASYTYHERNGKLETLTYGNGDRVKYLYDALDRVKEICYNTGEDGAWETVYSYEYTAEGALAKSIDHRSGETTAYAYDPTGKLLCTYHYDTEEGMIDFREDRVYDDKDRLTDVFYQLPYYYDDFDMMAGTVNYSARRSYGYNTTGQVSETTFAGGNLSGIGTLSYDEINRLSLRSGMYAISGTTAMQYSEEYNYIDTVYNENTTQQIADYTTSMTIGTKTVTSTYYYEYDSVGNLRQISTANGGIQYAYTYDSLGQLIREDNRPRGYTYLYSYDAAGNCTGRQRLAFTLDTATGRSSFQTFAYEDSTWGDLVTRDALYVYTYDETGNPILGCTEGSEWIVEYEWEGRQLMRYADGVDDVGGKQWFNTVTYTYNDEGIRTSKTVNGTVHEYTLNGSTVVAEKWTEQIVEHMLVYVYDEFGTPIAIQYRNTNYLEGDFDIFFLERNMFGDIIGIYNEAGERIGVYSYDAWGLVSSSYDYADEELEYLMVDEYNPFGYRGYFYDRESNLYYLQSRYYSPLKGRFINADAAEVITATPMGLTDKNLFAYCDNNPVMRTDEDGRFWHIVAGAAIGGLISGAVSAISQWATNGEINWGTVAIDAGAGAISGALAATGLGVVAQIASNAAITATQSALTQGVQDGFENIELKQVVTDGIIGGFVARNAGVGKGTSKHLMNQGKAFTKNISNKGISQASKYYFSQTAKLFYKPLARNSLKDFTRGLFSEIGGHYASQMYERYRYA